MVLFSLSPVFTPPPLKQKPNIEKSPSAAEAYITYI